jgi:uncharacterized tellurite resistance protein B-like protein
MKNQEFKDFLLKSAVFAMACDGKIEDSEIQEINKLASSEIYFLGYDFRDSLNQNINSIKVNGKASINAFLKEIELNIFNENQKILIIEIILRIIEADDDIQPNEIRFLQLVKSKLKINEQSLIINFPKHIGYLLEFQNYDLHQEFTDDINFNIPNI